MSYASITLEVRTFWGKTDLYIVRQRWSYERESDNLWGCTNEKKNKSNGVNKAGRETETEKRGLRENDRKGKGRARKSV